MYSFTTRITFSLLLVLLSGSTSYAFFGPGPNEEHLAAEMKKLVELQHAVGDHAFVTHVIPQLELIVEALPHQHPSYRDRMLQLGTGEHLQATRPYFAQAVFDLLGEIGDVRCLPVLQKFGELHQRDARTHPDSSRNMTLSWSGYREAAAAWLRIKGNEIGLQEAILAGKNDAVVEDVYLAVHGHPGLHDLDPLYEIDSAKVNVVVSLAQDSRWQLIETLAELRAFAWQSDRMTNMLSSDDPAVRVAAAIVLYRQHANPRRWTFSDPDQAAAGEVLWAHYQEHVVAKQAEPARRAVNAVWRDLIKRRRALDQEPAAIDWRTETQRIDQLMGHLVRLVAFSSTDPSFKDAFIDSIGWTGASTWLRRSVEHEDQQLTPEQWQRLIAWLDDPLITEEHGRALATNLIALDHPPAAPAIIRFYNQFHILDGLELHPRYLAGLTRYSHGATTGEPNWLGWLKEHAGTSPTQP